MRHYIPMVVMLAWWVLPAAADSIDDADAKRRGVSVAQVVVEHQLEAEKAKNAALEKQNFDLQRENAALKKQIADAKGGDSARVASRPASAPAGGEGPALNFDGPRQASVLYDGFVSRYLSGDWEKLGADMDAKKKEIAALPAGNAADLTYIARTIAECRPGWWNPVKSGQAKQFKQTVWNQSVTFNYQDGGIGTTVRTTDVNGEFQATVQWPKSNMDSAARLSLPEVGLKVPGDFGFQQGDGCNWAAWQVIGDGAALAPLGAEKIKALGANEQVKLTRYALFVQNITAGYYGTPAVRRMTCALSLASFEPDMNDNENWTGRRPLGSALLIELTVHKGLYKGFEVQPIAGLAQLAGNPGLMEGMLATPVMLAFAKNKLTLEQDRHIRDLIKKVAQANRSWTDSKLILPENQAYDLDPAKDAPLAAQRVKLVAK
jgi:hypothetical protein